MGERSPADGLAAPFVFVASCTHPICHRVPVDAVQSRKEKVFLKIVRTPSTTRAVAASSPTRPAQFRIHTPKHRPQVLTPTCASFPTSPEVSGLTRIPTPINSLRLKFMMISRTAASLEAYLHSRIEK